MRIMGFDFDRDFDNLERYPLLQDEVPMGCFGIVCYYAVMRMYGNRDQLYYNVDWAGVLV